MSRCVGGRRRLPVSGVETEAGGSDPEGCEEEGGGGDDDEGVGVGERESDEEEGCAPVAETDGLEDEGEGVSGRDLALALVRSIHGFSGGILGTVYWATAERERSQRLGAQTPTRTRHAATSRLALQYERRSEERQIEPEKKCMGRVRTHRS